MKKLLKFKNWLTIEDTATYLSMLLSEPIKPQDVLQLSLDGHLNLSLYFMNIAKVMEVEVTPNQDHESPKSALDKFDEVNFKNKSYRERTIEDLINIDGLWDLCPHLSNERYIKSKLKSLMSGEAQVSEHIPPTYLVRDGKTYRLYEKYTSFDKNNQSDSLALFLGEIVEIECHLPDDGYYRPVNKAPRDASLVISLKALKELESKLFNEDKPLNPVSERSYLNIIGALLEIMQNKSLTENQKKLFGNQEAILKTLVPYDKVDGVSQDNLKKKFAAANKHFKLSYTDAH